MVLTKVLLAVVLSVLDGRLFDGGPLSATCGYHPGLYPFRFLSLHVGVCRRRRFDHALPLSLGRLGCLLAVALKELVEGVHLHWCHPSTLLSLTELPGDLDRQVLAAVVICECLDAAGNLDGRVMRPLVVFGVFLLRFEELHQCVFAG